MNNYTCEHTNANNIWIQFWQSFRIFSLMGWWFTVAVHNRAIKTWKYRW